MLNDKTTDNVNTNELEPEGLIEYLSEICNVQQMQAIESIEDMRQAARNLGKLSSLYSYLTNMSLQANIRKRMYKKSKETNLFDRELIRETIFSNYADQIKMQYNATSRMLTIRQQIMEELKMSGETL